MEHLLRPPQRLTCELLYQMSRLVCWWALALEALLGWFLLGTIYEGKGIDRRKDREQEEIEASQSEARGIDYDNGGNGRPFEYRVIFGKGQIEDADGVLGGH